MRGSEGRRPGQSPQPEVRPAPISLYVHVPFCGRGKCAYCDFYSVPTPGAAAAYAVVRETLREAEAWMARLGRPPVETVFVGGGTPSSLEPVQLDGLLAGLRRLTGGAAGGVQEWTVEANPESLDRRFLDACREAGVDRISLGIQTLHDGLLARLGRIGDGRRGREALAKLVEDWPGRISADLLAGIPGQTEEDLLGDLERVTASPRVAHVSLYQLTPIPDTALAAAADPERQEALWLKGAAFLESRGRRNYEISNFARPGEESRHNLRYWLLEPYLGVGPAAVSTLPLGGRIVRLTHPESLEPFLVGGAPGAAPGWGAVEEEIGPQDFLFETLMMGLRLRDGIPAALFRRRFGRSLPEVLGPLWARWQGERLARAGQTRGADERRAAGSARDRHALTRRGRWRLDGLLREAAEHLEAHPPARLAVTWP